MATYLLPAVVCLPLLSAVLLFPLRREKRWLLVGFAALSALCGLVSLLPAVLLLSGQTVSSFSAAFCVANFGFEADAFRCLYGGISGLLFSFTALFSIRYFQKGEHLYRYVFANLVTFTGVLGVFFASDLLTLFCFFELLSLCSALFVVHEETPAAVRAAKTYLAVSIFGGMLLFLGLVYLKSITGTLQISQLSAALHGKLGSVKLWLSGLCLLLGFGAKAGLFPLQIWLPKAHPVAPAPASALLSGLLTKIGVFGVIITVTRIFAGNETMAWILLCLSAVTMLLGAVLGVFSVDLKRTLACSSMSQIGFVLSGVAASVVAPEAPAVSGSVLHMVNHSLIKLLLFLAAGAIYQGAHTLDLNRLRGYGRGKPLLAACFLLGGLDLAGVPGFGGYISKSLLHEGIVEAGQHLGSFVTVIEWVFLISGGLTLAYMMKLFLCIFVEKPLPDSPPLPDGKKSVSPLQKGILAVSALLILPTGLPAVSLNLGRVCGRFLCGEEVSFAGELFGAECLSGIAISLGIGLAVYLFVVRGILLRSERYLDAWPKWLDLETLVYHPLISVLCFVGRVVCRLADLAVDGFVFLLQKTVLHDRGVYGRPHTGSATTDFIGQVEDKITGKPGHVERLAVWRKHGLDGAKRLTGSFYFAMGAVCFGIVLILLFVLLEQFGF